MAVPLEVVDIAIHGLHVFLASPHLPLDHELGFLAYLLGRLEVNLLVPLASPVDLIVVFRKCVNHFHQLVKRAHFKLFFVDLK